MTLPRFKGLCWTEIVAEQPHFMILDVPTHIRHFLDEVADEILDIS